MVDENPKEETKNIGGGRGGIEPALLIRPQDKWAGGVADVEKSSDSPQRPKGGLVMKPAFRNSLIFHKNWLDIAGIYNQDYFFYETIANKPQSNHPRLQISEYSERKNMIFSMKVMCDHLIKMYTCF